MSEKMASRKKKPKMKMANAWLFSYAVVVGTSAPVLLSRCRANCATCGGCILLLGIVPLVLFVAAQNRLRRTVNKIMAFFQMRKKSKFSTGPR